MERGGGIQTGVVRGSVNGGQGKGEREKRKVASSHGYGQCS